MKKSKCMAEGGSSIDDDVRARALASVANLDTPDDSAAGKSGYGEENDMPAAAPKAKTAAAPKGAKAFTRAETGGGAALMTRKDRSDMPKPKAAKKSNYKADHTMGAAMKAGGKVSSASSRGDGCAVRGKTKGRMV